MYNVYNIICNKYFLFSIICKHYFKTLCAWTPKGMTKTKMVTFPSNFDIFVLNNFVDEYIVLIFFKI